MVNFDDFERARVSSDVATRLTGEQQEVLPEVTSIVPITQTTEMAFQEDNRHRRGPGNQDGTGPPVLQAGGGGIGLDLAGRAVEVFVDAAREAGETLGIVPGTNILEAAREDISNLPALAGDVVDIIGGFFTADPGRIGSGVADLFRDTLFPNEAQELGPTAPFPQTGGSSMVPGTGMPVGTLQQGGFVPNQNQIVKVWDTWPGSGVTGGGRAPIFAKTVDGKIYVRKLDGTIKKVPKSTNIVLNSRKLNLQTYIKAEKYLERITRRIAKSTRSLKRA